MNELLVKSDNIKNYSLDSSRAYCRRKTWGHYENFSVASFLFPRELRSPIETVYAYCRFSDDLGDENDGSKIQRELAIKKLNQWEHELNLTFDYAISIRNQQNIFPDTPPVTHPIFISLIDVIHKFNLPKEPFANLLIAFKQDQIKQEYQTLEELLDYCKNSADPVGRIVLHLAFAADKQKNDEITIDQKLINWSDSICTGLQLANFWQDIKRDLSIGRCYIPKNIASRYGVDLENLNWNQEFRSMMTELVEDAQQRIINGIPLLNEIPDSIKFNISIIIRGGLAILDAIKKINYNVLKKRPVVSGLKKLNIALAALLKRKIR